MQARGYAKFVLNIEVTRIILLIKNRSRYGEMLNLKKKVGQYVKLNLHNTRQSQ